MSYIVYDELSSLVMPANYRKEIAMPKRTLKFVFPPELITEPILHSLGHQFKVVTNIRRANVEIDKGWVLLELEGDGEEIERAVSWLTSKGVGIESANASIWA
jgi:ABC-type methionine transport system ATPase subunit